MNKMETTIPNKNPQEARLRASIEECQKQIDDYKGRIRGLEHDISGMKNALVKLRMKPIVEVD